MKRLILLSLLLSATAFARPGGHPPLSQAVLHNADELGLDEAALEAVQAIAADERAAREADRGSMKEAHEAMRALMEAEDLDADAVRAQHARLEALRAEAGADRLEVAIELRELLGADAWKRLHELKPERGERRRRRGPPKGR